MKNPITQRLNFKIAVLAVLTVMVIVVVYTLNLSNIEKQSEQRKRLPGSLLSMDLWSSMRSYPGNDMNARVYSRAFEKAQFMEMPQISAMQGIYTPTTAPWVNLGPKNFAGRILSIAFHPTDANIMWVGSASGGLWKTTTGGTGGPGGISWTYVPTTPFPVLGISSIVVHPTKPDTMYVGTGEVYSANSPVSGTIAAGHIRTFRGSYGIGILKTTDGGATWTKSLDFTDSNIKGVMDLLIHPTNPDTVFAATTDGIYRTFNAGTNWTLINSNSLAMDLIFKPGNPNIMYAGIGNFGSAGTGIYKTTNANAISPTFTKLAGGLPANEGKTMLTISAASPNKIYASIGRDPNGASTDPCGLYYSLDEGVTWNATSWINASSKVTTQGWYGHDIGAHPVNHNTVIWSELDTWRTLNAANASPTLTKVGFWDKWNVNNTTIGTTMEGVDDNYVHADIHRISFSPHDATGNTVFICSDGGLFKSTDGGANYQTLNGGLVTAQIYSNMAISKTDPNFMVGGLQDNEGFIYSGSAGCRRIPSLGDGFHCAINTRDDDTCYVSGYYFNLKRSVNRGTSFSSPSPAVYLGNPPSEPASFNTPFVIAPSNPDIMYAGTYRIKKSTNRGATWVNTASALFSTSCTILYIAVAPTNPDIFYMSVTPGGAYLPRILKSTNGGSTYTDVTGSLPNRYFSDIEVDPTDPNRVAVSVTGFGTSHVYLTHNGGTSWSNVGGGLTDIPTNTVMFDPTNRSTIYIGNDQGVFYANNVPTSGALGATTALTWFAYNDGFNGATMVSDILVTSTNKLRLATYGRGLWERDFAPASMLPVVFKRFDINVINAGNQLRWTISSQSDVSRYDIEYSTDGLNFSKVGSVPAVSSPGDITYTFLHTIKNDVNGFYRIRNIDIDDSYTFSPVEMVKAYKRVVNLTIRPNPTTGMFKVSLPSGINEPVRLIVYDQTGRLVLLKNLNPQGAEIPVDISKVSQGTYQVVVEGAKTRWVASVIKK